jgi:hypothetical protein
MAAFSDSSIKPKSFSNLLITLYPKKEYPASEHAKTSTIHFLLAHNQKQDVIIAYAKKYNAKILTIDVNCYRFTPLLIAIIQGKLELVREIMGIADSLGKLSDVLNHSDAFGWTACHHAANSAKEIYQLITQKPGVILKKNSMGCLPSDIRMLTDLTEPTPIVDRAYIIEEGKEIAISELSQEKLKEKLDLDVYRSFPYFPPDQIFVLWQNPPPIQEKQLLNNLKIYSKLIETPPKLLVRSCEALRVIGVAARELVAGEDLSFGRGISVYSGEFCSKLDLETTFKAEVNDDSTRTTVKFHPFYSEKIGNVSRYANCDFPNAIIVDLNIYGIDFSVLVSLGIRRGEPIVWNYGGLTSLQFGKQMLFRREALREYFIGGIKKVETEFSKLMESHKKIMSGVGINPDLAFEFESFIPKLLFPLSSPAALLDLHFSGIILASEWDSVLNNNNNQIVRMWAEEKNRYFWCIRVMLSHLSNLDSRLNANSVAKKTVSTWVLKKIGHLSIMELFKIFEKITTKEISSLSTESEWMVFLTELEYEIKDYKWVNDDKAPISIFEVKKFILDFYKTLDAFKKINFKLSLVQACEGALEGSDIKEIYKHIQEHEIW